MPRIAARCPVPSSVRASIHGRKAGLTRATTRRHGRVNACGWRVVCVSGRDAFRTQCFLSFARRMPVLVLLALAWLLAAPAGPTLAATEENRFRTSLDGDGHDGAGHHGPRGCLSHRPERQRDCRGSVMPGGNRCAHHYATLCGLRMSVLSLPAIGPAALDEPAYPRDMYGLIRQCAWCRRVADSHGAYRLWAARLISSASHGCCATCASSLLKDTRGLASARALAGAA